MQPAALADNRTGTIAPDLQRFMARRVSAKTIEFDASHLSLITQPTPVANLIVEAAA